ncbi:hypothetical protein [Alloyangia pacifica]|uniref:Periplasmic protein-like protein n=1 Tax=Alloyangia pacifica TaxID=311180 RepID=A0A1I6SFL7_9RHOB|nr:hypothetical protein [Alloyangia pacifica]SDG78332.1 hypothetical protein SAMN04488245_104343 [Alloyangia pacifica]SFS75776.1 hypothetical protein SAMN04488050_104343 [Alloyangia pacifica]
MRHLTVARALTGALVLQIALGAFLVLGDLTSSDFTLPRFGPSAPRLTQPVQPGDQRRTFAPGRDLPPRSPLRDPGKLPERLALTRSEGSAWRLEGGISEGDAERIISALDDAQAGSNPIETLVLQSPGGSVPDALAIGRHVRQMGLGTRMLEGEFCYSACPYLLASGTTREIPEGASVGVHQHYFGESTILPAFVAVEQIQRGQGEVMEYLEEMGIDPMVLRPALATPADQIYILLPEELARYNFVTEES